LLTYDVFVIDAKAKFIKNKTVKDKRIADSAKTATEKHIVKLIKLKVYRVMTLNVCSSASFVKKTRTPKHPAEEDSDSKVGPIAYVVSMIQYLHLKEAHARCPKSMITMTRFLAC
jgi:hypothetical protein